MSNALKRLQIRRRELGMLDDDYRALLRRVTGQESSRGLTDAQILRVLDAMAGGDGRRRAEGEVPAKVRALVWDLYHLGAWNGPPTERAIAAFVARQAKVDDLRWLTPDRISSVVDALRDMLRRAGLQLPSGVRTEQAELMLLEAQERRLEALGEAPGDRERRQIEVGGIARRGATGADLRRQIINANGARIRELLAAEREVARD